MSDKPVCKLIGEDGNVFAIIARVSKTLKKAGLEDRAQQFKNKVQRCADYNAVLRLAMTYVEVE